MQTDVREWELRQAPSQWIFIRSWKNKKWMRCRNADRKRILKGVWRPKSCEEIRVSPSYVSYEGEKVERLYNSTVQGITWLGSEQPLYIFVPYLVFICGFSYFPPFPLTLRNDHGCEVPWGTGPMTSVEKSERIDAWRKVDNHSNHNHDHKHKPNADHDHE